MCLVLPRLARSVDTPKQSNGNNTLGGAAPVSRPRTRQVIGPLPIQGEVILDKCLVTAVVLTADRLLATTAGRWDDPHPYPGAAMGHHRMGDRLLPPRDARMGEGVPPQDSEEVVAHEPRAVPIRDGDDGSARSSGFRRRPARDHSYPQFEPWTEAATVEEAETAQGLWPQGWRS